MQSAKGDHVLMLLVFVLLVFGLIMITSIGVPKSIQLSAPGVLYPDCGSEEVDCYLLFKKHLFRLAIGVVAFFLAAKIPFQFWRKASPVIFGLVLLLLISTLIIGSTHGTFAKSWLTVFDTSIQPSEFAKLALVFYFAHWIEKRRNEIRTFKYGFLPFCAVASILTIPVAIQPDLGSTLIILVTATAMYFVGGAKWRHILFGLLVAGLLAFVFIGTVPHIKQRFQAFLSPAQECSEDYCWQTVQANIAIGSGGFFGKGLTQGVQKSYWLPQATDDFIFAASAEELGFLRVMLVVVVYFLIAWRGYQIADHAPTDFGKLTSVGIVTWISFQAFLNIMVNIGLFPVTGITLPFVSYGGSSLVATLIGVGVLMNISHHIPQHAYSFFGRRNAGTHSSQSHAYRRG